MCYYLFIGTNQIYDMKPIVALHILLLHSTLPLDMLQELSTNIMIVKVALIDTCFFLHQ